MMMSENIHYQGFEKNKIKKKKIKKKTSYKNFLV